MTTPARSLLFVPGDRPERFDKAAASGAHRVILDLEDAVAPAAKAVAREAVAQWLSQGHTALVRINAADTPWFDEDLRMLRVACGAGLMLPKANPEAMAHAAADLQGRELIALVETVAGHAALPALAAVPGLTRMAFGSVDFATESGIADEGEALTGVRTAIVLASCLAGLQAPVDGVSLELTNEARITDDARRSRRLGFGGKLCIHPRQVAPLAAAFRPTPEELRWAHRVLAAFEASGGAATALDGKMIDKPVVDRARQLASTEPGSGAA